MSSKFDWDEADHEEKLEALRMKLKEVIEFIDNHAHTADGFVHSRESIYSLIKGEL